MTALLPPGEPNGLYHSEATETSDPDEAYGDSPGDFEPVRLPWPL